jgi:hypothetical protein
VNPRKQVLTKHLNRPVRSTRVPYAFRSNGQTFVILAESEADRYAKDCAVKQAYRLPVSLLAQHLNIPRPVKAARLLKSLGRHGNELLLALIANRPAFENETLRRIGRSGLIGPETKVGVWRIYRVDS